MKKSTFRVLNQEDGKTIAVKNIGGAFSVKEFVVQMQIPLGKSYPSNEEVEQLLKLCFRKCYGNRYVLFKITGRGGVAHLPPQTATLEKYSTRDVPDVIREGYQEKQVRTSDFLEIHGFVVLEQ